MQNSKLDLYNAEWLDLVFENRNKAYGAYELRQHYGNTMSKAMGFTFFCLAVVIGVAYALHKPVTDGPLVQVDTFELKKVTPPPVEHPKVDPPKIKSLPAAKPVSTLKFVPPVVTAEPVREEPPKIEELEKVAIGTSTVKVPGNGQPIDKPVNSGDGSGTSTISPTDNTPVDASGGLEVMPEPFGGAAAWSKFLQRNIRYPALARENGLSGKVWLSFIIERDGKLSNIEVIRPAGNGFDEEATRVLRLAPAWKPGKQNGQLVRVKYTIPINFQLAEE
jgi:protein TonB